MKVISIAVAGVALALIALTLVPAAGDYRPYLAVAALLCAAIVLGTIAVGWRDRSSLTGLPPASVGEAVSPTVREHAAAPADSQAAPPSTAPPAVTPHAVPTVASATTAGRAGDFAVVGFLAALQEKGRLVDFLMDDITSYSDAQVGAAARIVHAGCKLVLHDYFRIVPVREENEGSRVTVAAGYPTDEYRLVGKISGEAPFSGTLMHRGWKADAVTLPRVLRSDDDTPRTIAPAEVELP